MQPNVSQHLDSLPLLELYSASQHFIFISVALVYERAPVADRSQGLIPPYNRESALVLAFSFLPFRDLFRCYIVIYFPYIYIRQRAVLRTWRLVPRATSFRTYTDIYLFISMYIHDRCSRVLRTHYAQISLAFIYGIHAFDSHYFICISISSF